MSLVRTLRFLPSRSLGPSSLFTLLNPRRSLSPLLSSLTLSLDTPRCLSVYPFVTLALTFPFSSVFHFLSSTAIVAVPSPPPSLSLSLSFSFAVTDHRAHQLLSPSYRNLSYCFVSAPPGAPLSSSSCRSGPRSLLLGQADSAPARKRDYYIAAECRYSASTFDSRRKRRSLVLRGVSRCRIRTWGEIIRTFKSPRDEQHERNTKP